MSTEKTTAPDDERSLALDLAYDVVGRLGCCEGCGGRGERYRQRTSYNDDERNWITLCPICREDNDAHWDEMWADYYGGRL